MSKLATYQKLALILFVIIELVGFVGIISDHWHDHFVSLTPVNLVFISVVLMLFHRTFSMAESIWMATVFIAGYLVEVLGVKTGMIFGEYSYGQGLGPKIFEVPPTMGVNWFLLCYTSVRLVNPVPFHFLVKAALSATVMVALDAIMEPVAIAFDFWSWKSDEIPLQNYLAWWLIAFGLNSLWFVIKEKAQNIFSGWLFIYLVVFFTVMNIVFA